MRKLPKDQMVEAMKKLNENAKVQVLTEKGEVVLTVDGRDGNFALFVVHEEDEPGHTGTMAMQYVAAKYLPSVVYTVISSVLDQVKEIARGGDLMESFALLSEFESALEKAFENSRGDGPLPREKIFEKRGRIVD